LIEEGVMADELSKRGPQDCARINLHAEHEVRYWTEAFGITPDRLELLVKQVGISAEKVRAQLEKG
jgi:hypothetical protein